jgi:ferredoxin-NADP reductase
MFLLLAAKEESLLCFKDQILEITRRNPNIKVAVFLSRRPAETMRKTNVSWQFYNRRLDMDFLQQEFSQYRRLSFYICGPEKMTGQLTEGIGTWKGKRVRVYSENFGTQKKSTRNRDKSKGITVHFAKSNKTVQWDHEYMNILEFAESQDVRLEAGCMFGECGACSTKLISGSVEYHHQTATSPVKGNCLPCSCFPTSNITLNA